MYNRIARRSFHKIALGALALAAGSRFSIGEEPKKTLDLHIHLFGVGDAGSGCRMSTQITEGIQFRALSYSLDLKRKGKTIDEAYVNVLAEQLKGSGLTKGLILGQDAVYDSKGKPDWDRTHFYTPNDYVFQITEKHKELMLPCVSINPERADAIEELLRCHAKGAKIFKIHPPTQGVDISDRKHKTFFETCAEKNMIVMVHTGHEHSAPVIDVRLAGPRKLEFGLSLGCTMVACHSGTGWPTDRPEMLTDFLLMLKQYPKLWGETSVLGTFGRVRDFLSLIDNKEASARLLHGSDFPFPANPISFAKRIGDTTAKSLNAKMNLIERDFELKKALGIGLDSAVRSFELVAGAQRNK